MGDPASGARSAAAVAAQLYVVIIAGSIAAVAATALAGFGWSEVQSRFGSADGAPVRDASRVGRFRSYVSGMARSVKEKQATRG